MKCKLKESCERFDMCDRCELVSVVDYNCQRLMMCTPKFAPVEEGTYRLSVQVWIKCLEFDGLYVIQKRADTTGYFPGKWATLTGGVRPGEDTERTISREAKEEMGIEVKNFKFLMHNKHEQYIEEVWYAETSDTGFHLQKEEVATILFLRPNELLEYKAKGLMSENMILPSYLWMEEEK